MYDELIEGWIGTKGEGIMTKTRNITVVTTGGTIATPADRKNRRRLTARDLEKLVAQAGDLDFNVRWHDFCNLPSSALSTGHVLELLEYLEGELAGGAEGLVVTHGTDILEETAYLMSLLWRHDEPLVLTGAMRSAGSPGADGPRNLVASLVVAGSDASRGRGPLVLLNDRIHLGAEVTKIHSWAVETFTSELGPIGLIDQWNDLRYHRQAERSRVFPRPQSLDEAVPVITSGMGSKGCLVDALDGAGFRALVVEGAGRGAIPPDLREGLERAAETGMIVVVASRCAFGGTASGFSKGNVIAAGDLNGPKARIKLMLALSLFGPDAAKIREVFS